MPSGNTTTYRLTLDVTGRDIVNALKAGKVVLIHTTLADGTESYAGAEALFSEANDYFSMPVYVPAISAYVEFAGGLDDELVINRTVELND